MPALPVEFTRRAAREVEAAADWWHLNRPGAPGAVHSDLKRALTLIGLDRVEKLRSYARAGVSHAWLVNPSPRTLEIFRRHGSEWTLVGAHGGEEIVQVEPFDAIEWHLGLLWGGPGA